MKDALEAYRMAIRLEPGNRGTLASLSALLLHRGELLEAAELLRIAVGNAGDVSTAARLQWRLGCALLHSGRQKEANDAWSVILEMAEAPEGVQEQARRTIAGIRWPSPKTKRTEERSAADVLSLGHSLGSRRLAPDTCFPIANHLNLLPRVGAPTLY